MTLHTYTPNQCPYQVSTSYTLRFLRYSPDKIFKLKVTTARSKVKSRSHHDVAHLHPQPMSLPSINFLHLTVSEIQPGQTFSRRLPSRHGNSCYQKLAKKHHHYSCSSPCKKYILKILVKIFAWVLFIKILPI